MHHGHSGHGGHCGPCTALFHLVEKLFWAAATTCFLYAMHRIATSLKLQARVKVLDELEKDLSEEERAVLVAKVKARAISL